MYRVRHGSFQEFLATLGLEAPTTTEEYAEVLRQIKAGDPNGNGEDDELPLSGSSLVWHGVLHEFVHLPPGVKPRLIVVDGKVTTIHAQDA
jgi:ABC-type glycerol-3-phosphate transport system substrate-binding protein